MTTETTAVNCELCVIGAGITGLNAVHSASCYLKPNDKVVLVDQRQAPGGMWQNTYDYVRLHQPHPMFTVGNIKWKKAMPAPHLADKQEVNEQFRHCLNTLAERVDLCTLFEHSYVEHKETGQAVRVEVKNNQSGETIQIQAKRFIYAPGANIQNTKPLEFSSSKVHSITPTQAGFPTVGITESDEPIVIVGGGKSAMDTAHYLLERFPNRDIRMLVGKGVMFINRNRAYREGIRRWLGGVTTFGYFLKMALKFNGKNIAETNRYRIDETKALSLIDNPKHFFVGLISEEEVSFIRQGLSAVVEDYLDDVVDTEAGVQMRMRSGENINLPAGSCFINCTGYICTERVPYQPYVSESGRVLALAASSLPFFLGSFCGYYLTHLMYRGQILEVPLYAIDVPELIECDKAALGPIAETTTVLNVLRLMKALPTKIFNDCELDFNRWYPLPRRLPILLKFMLQNDRIAAHCEAALDTYQRQSGLRMGRLPYVGDASAKPQQAAA